MDALTIATGIVLRLQVDLEHRMRERELEDRTLDYSALSDLRSQDWLPEEYLW